MTKSSVELVDGGVWANNPVGAAAIEAIGLLGWPAGKLKILSLGTINEPRDSFRNLEESYRWPHE